MDAVVAEIKKQREQTETQNAIYVNKLKFENVLRQIEKEGETVNSNCNLTPSMLTRVKQKPTYLTSILNYFY
jgi:hypothetical protein